MLVNWGFQRESRPPPSPDRIKIVNGVTDERHGYPGRTRIISDSKNSDIQYVFSAQCKVIGIIEVMYKERFESA
jgi:hypothetical protein